MDEEKVKKYLKGTTTVGFICADGVVLASDRRATMGFFIADKDAQKIYQIDDKLAMTTAGMVADNQVLVRNMRAQTALYKMDGKPMSVKSASTLLSNILHSNRFYPLMAQLIVGGYDEKPTIFELDPIGGMSEKSVCSTGSGSLTAYGVLETQYNETITVEEGIKLAVKCIRAALERDAGTGNGVDVITIKENGLERVPEETIQTIYNGLASIKG
ncbi:MAG: archaeal proteasome endopeptidase complex subunit beta [archaeon]